MARYFAAERDVGATQAGDWFGGLTLATSTVDAFAAAWMRASRLFVMIKERGYPGGPDHLRRLVGRLRPRKAAEAFQRLRTMPGEQAQGDWAHFGKLEIGRAQRPLWAFVMVLSYSRRLFLRFSPGASMPFFVAGHVEA